MRCRSSWMGWAAACLLVLAAWSTAAAEAPEISGRIKLFSTVYMESNPAGAFFSHGAGEFGFKRIETRLKLSGSLSDRVSYAVRLDAYSYPGDLIAPGSFPEAGPLGTSFSTEYFEANIYEANIKVARFLLPKLDLTIGKQRIGWGTADKVGVLDNLNPLDFANFFSFDPDYFAERRPQTGFNFEYYISDSTKLQLVWLIQAQVSPMPYGYTSLTENFYQLQSMTIDKGWDSSLGKTSLGLRLSTRVLNTDISLSYYQGNFSLPLLSKLTVYPEVQGAFYYPRLQVFGLDCAGEVEGVGFWGELAVMAPEDVQASLQVPAMIDQMPTLVDMKFPLFESTTVKYVLGADYNFGRGFYANVQYLHGFFDEIGYSQSARTYFGMKQGMFFGQPSDYILGRVEYKTAGGTVKIKAGGLVEMDGASSSFVFMPELEFRAADSLIIQAGAFKVLSGDESSTKFGMFKKDGMVYAGLRLDF